MHKSKNLDDGYKKINQKLDQKLKELKKFGITNNKKDQLRIKLAISLAETRGFNDWVEVDTKNLKGTFMRNPERKELPSEINESLIVELYSK